MTEEGMQSAFASTFSCRDNVLDLPSHPREVDLQSLSTLLSTISNHSNTDIAGRTPASFDPSGSERVDPRRNVESYLQEFVATEKLMQLLTTAMNGHAGLDYIDRVVEFLQREFDCLLVNFGRVVGEKRDRIETISINRKGEKLENFSYSAVGTPCEKVVQGNVCIYEKNMTRLFSEAKGVCSLNAEAYAGTPLHGSDGRVIGVLMMLLPGEIENPDLMATLMRFLAVRSQGELEQYLRIRRLERDLSESEFQRRLKEDIVSALSHEIRTPLNSISGYAQMLSGEILGPIGNESYRDYANSIHFSATYLSEISDRIFDYQRIERGILAPELERLRLSELIADIRTLMAFDLEQGDVRLDIDIGEDTPFEADRRLLTQVIVNVLNNAIRHAGPDIVLTVIGDVTAQERRIRIRDNGRGMPADEVQGMLQPFVRGRTDRRATAKGDRISADGLGLGLALCRDIMHLHGGRFEIDSELGRGTEVRLGLPISPDPGMDLPVTPDQDIRSKSSSTRE